MILIIAAVDITLVRIPVDHLPILPKLLLTAIQSVPAAYDNPLSRIASHIIAVP